jgi:transposase-like protein
MDGTVAQNPETAFSGAIKLDEAEVGRHLSEMVRETVEQTLNKLLDAEADAVCRATRYERSAECGEPLKRHRFEP